MYNKAHIFGKYDTKKRKKERKKKKKKHETLDVKFKFFDRMLKLYENKEIINENYLGTYYFNSNIPLSPALVKSSLRFLFFFFFFFFWRFRHFSRKVSQLVLMQISNICLITRSSKSFIYFFFFFFFFFLNVVSDFSFTNISSLKWSHPLFLLFNHPKSQY